MPRRGSERDRTTVSTTTEMMEMESSSDDGPLSRCKASITYFSKGTIFSSIFNLLTTSIGAGTLALPFAYSRGGLVFSSIVFFIIMLMSIIVGLYLYEGKRICQDICPNMEVRGYEDLAEVSFGPIGRVAVLITLLVFLLLTLVAYMMYTRDQLDFVIHFFIRRTGYVPQCSLFTNCAIIMCLAYLPLFPILLLKKISMLQLTSTISIICVFFVAIMISVKAGIYIHDPNITVTVDVFTKYGDMETIGLFPESVRGAIMCISYCGLTFLLHFQLFSVEKELQNPTTKKLNGIVITSIVIAYGMYNLVAIGGYLRFGGETPEDIMTAYSSDNLLVTLLRIALFFTLLFSYPILFYPTREAINRLAACIEELYLSRGQADEGLTIQEADQADERKELLKSTNIFKRFKAYNERIVHRKEVKVSWVIWFCETWALFSLSFLPAAFISNVGYVWNFVGSIGGSFVLYIIPSLLYLRLRYFLKAKLARESGKSLFRQYLSCSVWKDLIGAVILATGIFVLIAGNYDAIDAIIEGSHSTPRNRCSTLTCVYMNVTAELSLSGEEFNEY